MVFERRRFMRLLCIGVVLAFAANGFADVVTLKSGRVVEGTYLGGSPRQVRVEVGDQIQNLDVADIVRIEFGGSQSAAPVAPPEPLPRRSENEFRNVPPPPADQANGELPAGTNLVVRMI